MPRWATYSKLINSRHFLIQTHENNILNHFSQFEGILNFPGSHSTSVNEVKNMFLD